MAGHIDQLVWTVHLSHSLPCGFVLMANKEFKQQQMPQASQSLMLGKAQTLVPGALLAIASAFTLNSVACCADHKTCRFMTDQEMLWLNCCCQM